MPPLGWCGYNLIQRDKSLSSEISQWRIPIHPLSLSNPQSPSPTALMHLGFLARSWHVKSKGIFALSCIGVVALVIALEFLRRLAKEYDRRIVASYARSLAPARSSNSSDAGKTPATTAAPAHAPACAALPAHRFRPNVPQQAIRALLHMLQFAVAYFVMLLAMYYNGYIIICIFIGAYLGYFIFGWESFGVGQGGGDRMEENVTVCCG